MGILITILWIGYGLFTYIQSEMNDDYQIDYFDWTLLLLLIVFAPLILIARAIYGMFILKL